ncbi:MAG: hypothetical protein C0507_25570 [Cyanobacteria bacterium PR.3.49]|nr:hypothetical protein [Cyanobacteria bacterium PR.3.49]
MCEIVSLAFTQLQDATRLVMRLTRLVFFLQSITAAVIREKQRIANPGSLYWWGANCRAMSDTKRISLPWLNLFLMYVIGRPPLLVGGGYLVRVARESPQAILLSRQFAYLNVKHSGESINWQGV